jgi:polyphosphate kinase 2 (PPK2 family)
MGHDPVVPGVPDFARYRVDLGEPVSVAGHDSADTAGYAGRDEAYAELPRLVLHIAHLRARLYAEENRDVLVVLQGMDAAGKDSSVKHVFRGTNPQGVRVYSFKQPSNDEAAHDFSALPPAHARRRDDPRLQPLAL